MIKKRITIIFSLVGLVLVMAAGTSFAYLRVTRTQTDQNEVSSLDCLEVQMLDGQNAFNIQNAYPIKDEVGEEQTPYEFNLVNNCGQGVKVDIAFEVLSGSTLSANNLKVNLARHNGVASNAILSSLPIGQPLNNGTAYIMRSDYLYGNESKDYDFRMWLPYELTEADIYNNVLTGKIVVTATVIDSDEFVFPQWWENPTKGTLLGGIKRNNEIVTDGWTIPGRQTSTQGNATRTSLSSTLTGYYWTYGDGYTIDNNGFSLTNPSTCRYSSCYTNLVGKYLVSSSSYSNSSYSNTKKTTTGLTNVYRVIYTTSNYIMLERYNYLARGTAASYKYWTYGTGAESASNTSTAIYNLTGVNVIDYDEDYGKLVGKFLASASNASLTLSYIADADQSTAKTTSNISYIHEVIEATPNYIVYKSAIESTFGQTEDDYGTSYYYRGAVDNNFVVFANMCWRIVRIDGLGNIKLTLYNYNPTHSANPCSSSLDGETMAFARLNPDNANNYKSAFNTLSSKNTYIGFMYSNNLDSTDFNIAHANDKDSTILTKLKTWYDVVFTQSDKEKLADVIWCNDKRVVSDTTYKPFSYNNILGTGLGTDPSYYQAIKRIYPLPQAVPSLKCGTSKTDNLISKFTASTSTDGGWGNGKLNGYKIGLLTSDEIVFAGGVELSSNLYYYLHKNTNGGYALYWSMSPEGIFGADAVVIGVADAGSVGGDSVNRAESGIRPAVSLKSNTTISGGNGTQESPFVVN